MRATFAASAVIAMAVILHGSGKVSAQWSENKVTVRGMFGDRVMGDTFKPRPSKFGGTLQRGPSGNFLGRARDARGRMFNPASAADRYRAPVAHPSPQPQPTAEPQPALELQPPLPLPEYGPVEPIETMPGEPASSAPDLWMRAPPSRSSGGSSVSGQQSSGAANPVPAPGSGAMYRLPLSSRYAIGTRDNTLRPIRQVSRGGYIDSGVTSRLRKSLGNRARSPLSVTLVDGTATVRGRVATENDRRLITYLLMFEPGVRQVDNQVSSGERNLLTGGPGS